MLKVKPFKQKPSLCGPASLKMVLEYFGVHKSEKELGKLAGTTLAKGTSAEGLVKAARKLGFRAEKKDFATLGDIRREVVQKKTPVIVDWFSGDDGHYSVVMGIDKENIYLQDPELGHLRTLRLETFRRVWFDFSSAYPRSKNDLILRRMIVVSRNSRKE